MNETSYQIIDGKVIIRVRDRICEKPEELFSSDLFMEMLKRATGDLQHRNSPLLDIFPNPNKIAHTDLRRLADTLTFLTKVPADLVPRLVEGSETFFEDHNRFNDFIEYLYNYWRSTQRLIICDSEGSRFDQRPYRTFNNTVEQLTGLIRSTYRDLQESITGAHPRIYRQVRAGAEIAAIARPRDIRYPDDRYHIYQKLAAVPVIRQVLIYPPLIFNPPMNKRSGEFEHVQANPLDQVHLPKEDWLCYPARVGSLLVMIYFSLHFFELGFSLCNLFELADDEDLKRTPDAVLLYGVPDPIQASPNGNQTVFYEDKENNLLVGSIPGKPEYGYFGYLKKMALTLHNVKMMKRGRMPFHGAMLRLTLHGHKPATVLVMGDTGTGKSETLEALRSLASDEIEDLLIIADDMGSLEINKTGKVMGYGTETGAFVRLDDLNPGFAFGQIDRTIILNPAQTNARVVLPVTTYENIIHGFPVDIVLYANNFEEVNADSPVIQPFDSAETALQVFRAGEAMSKGTTTATGKTATYFANVFGPMQYQTEHEVVAKRYFQTFFDQGLFVGQMRTCLGIPGCEQKGPQAAAQALLALVRKR